VTAEMTKLYAPAAGRNGGPIAEVLATALPERPQPDDAEPLVLEVASGSGEHAVRFARRFPQLIWQPSDQGAEAVRSIEAWRREAQLANLRPPIELDVETPSWPLAAADALVCINMLHISPWTAAEGLFAGASALLPTDGLLFIYGPFNVGGAYTSDGNRAFDSDLRGRDPRLGLRDVEQVEQAAAARGLRAVERVSMPANNLSLLFRREERFRTDERMDPPEE
jgi:hypothetical protein